MRFLLLGTTAIYAGLFVQPAVSQSWNNAGGTSNWGEAGNWDSGAVPDGDDAAVTVNNGGGPETIQLQNGDGSDTTFTVNTLDIQSDAQLSGGTLVLDGDGAGLSYSGSVAGDVLADDAELQLDDDATIAAATDFSAAANIGSSETATLSVEAAAGTETAISGPISGGSLSVETTGDGDVTLSGENTYGGATNVRSGSLTVSGSLTSETVAVDAGASLTAGGGSLAAGTDLSNAGSVTLAGDETVSSLNGTGTVALEPGNLTLTSGTSSIGGEVSGSGGLTVAGGDVTLSADNSYTGATGVQSGSLTVGSGSDIEGTVSVSGGSLNSFGQPER